MKTNIISNGSKWAGESPDSIEKLFEVIESETLEPLWGHPIQTNPELLDGSTHWGTIFSGNFCNLSHVFRIETDDPDLIESLTYALEANMSSDAYKRACVEHDEHEKAQQGRALKRLRQAALERRQAARRTLGIL